MQNKEIETEKVLKILENIARLSGQSMAEVLKEFFKLQGKELPNYKGINAPWSYKNIKENDYLIFDMDSIELKDGKIYIVKLKALSKPFLLYGEYEEKRKVFILGDRTQEFIKSDDVIPLGRLISIQESRDI